MQMATEGSSAGSPLGSGIDHSPPPPRIRPTVCTNRAMEVIAPCLNALSQTELAQGSIVVLSGLSEDMERELTGGIRHILPHAHVVVSDTGLSAARNAALEAADHSDVVAYVDDDAVVGPTWAHGMQRAWAGPSPD